MKKYLYILLIAVVVFACRQEDVKEYPKIKLGKESETLTEININKFTERKIILSGGDKKYSVEIADSRVVKALIHKDTLKIKALLEGETFASIKSYNEELILDINVIKKQISISEELVELRPKQVSKFVSVHGGGDLVEMKEIDPENILTAKWNGQTGILELKAFYEGDAIIKFSSNNIDTKQVKVKVRSIGEPTEIGIYSTINKTIYTSLKPIMIIKRKNVGTWLSVSTNPYGVANVLNTKIVARFDPIKNPKLGMQLNIKVSFAPYVSGVSNVSNGINKVYVEQLNKRKKTVLLRGRGFKIVLPFE